MLIWLYLFNILKQIMEVEALQSFLEVAPESEFPLENIPFGVGSLKTSPHDKRPATRIGIL